MSPFSTPGALAEVRPPFQVRQQRDEISMEMLQRTSIESCNSNLEIHADPCSIGDILFGCYEWRSGSW